MPEAITEKKIDRVDEFRKIIKSGEDRVDAGTEDCTKWLFEHKGSCTGCPSDLGCMKLVQLLRLQLPNGLPEKRIIEHMTDVLNARTVEGAKDAYCPHKVQNLD